MDIFLCRLLDISLNPLEGACRKLIQVEVEGGASQKRETKRGLYELRIHVPSSRLSIAFYVLTFYQSIVQRANRIARDLDASAERETSQGRGGGGGVGRDRE